MRSVIPIIAALVTVVTTNVSLAQSTATPPPKSGTVAASIHLSAPARRCEARRAGTCHNAVCWARRDQPINAADWRSVRWKGRPLTRDKESPGVCRGFKDEQQESSA